MENKRKGFTLVELLLVISVICLMMAILMPALSKAKELAKRAVCANQLRQIGVAIHTYTGRYDGLLPWWGYEPDGSEEIHPYVAYRSDWRDPATTRFKPMRMACLYEGGYLEDAKIFYCPSNRNAFYRYESYVKFKGKPTKWGFLPQDFNTRDPDDPDSKGHNQWVRVGYIYFPTDPRSEKVKVANLLMDYPEYVAKKMDRLDSRIPFMSDVIRHNTKHPKEELSHKTRNTYGLHAMFSDGHVTFCKDNYVFDDPVWLGGAFWRQFYYRVFNLVAEVE